MPLTGPSAGRVPPWSAWLEAHSLRQLSLHRASYARDHTKRADTNYWRVSMSRGRGARASILALMVPLLTVLVGVDASGAPDKADLTGHALTPAQRVAADKAPTSRLAQTDKNLLGRTDSAPVSVLVKLDYDSVATYSGGMAGLEATSPAVTGTSLSEETDALRAYEAHVASKENAFGAELAKRVPDATVGRALRTVYGGVAVTVPANKISDVLAIPGVVAVQEDAMRAALTDSSPRFLGAPTIYNELGSTSNAGQGVIYG